MSADEHLGYQFSHYTENKGRTHVFDAHHEGVNIGYAFVDDKGDHTFLDSVKVERNHRQHGVGRQLVTNAIEMLGDREMRLKAEPFDNKPLSTARLQRFYGSMGFRKSGPYMTRQPD